MRSTLPQAPHQVSPGSLKQALLQLTHVSQKRQRPYPPSCRTPKPIPSLFKSLELFFFAASQNTTPCFFFQVSSKSVYLNRTSFFNGYQGLVRCRYSLNYSYVCKEHILKFSNERASLVARWLRIRLPMQGSSPGLGRSHMPRSN